MYSKSLMTHAEVQHRHFEVVDQYSTCASSMGYGIQTQSLLYNDDIPHEAGTLFREGLDDLSG